VKYPIAITILVMSIGVKLTLPLAKTLVFSDWDLSITTLDSLKAWISQKTGQPECSQRLVLNGKVLGDHSYTNRSLYDENVRDGSTILVLKHSGEDDRLYWQSARQIKLEGCQDASIWRPSKRGASI
jgi:hypothetical protein